MSPWVDVKFGSFGSHLRLVKAGCSCAAVKMSPILSFGFIFSSLCLSRWFYVYVVNVNVTVDFEFVAPALVDECGALPLAATCAATPGPAPVTEYVAPAPDVTYPAPAIEYVAPASDVTFAAPSFVIEFVAPAPAGEGSCRWKRHLTRPST